MDQIAYTITKMIGWSEQPLAYTRQFLTEKRIKAGSGLQSKLAYANSRKNYEKQSSVIQSKNVITNINLSSSEYDQSLSFLPMHALLA